MRKVPLLWVRVQRVAQRHFSSSFTMIQAFIKTQLFINQTVNKPEVHTLQTEAVAARFSSSVYSGTSSPDRFLTTLPLHKHTTTLITLGSPPKILVNLVWGLSSGSVTTEQTWTEQQQLISLAVNLLVQFPDTELTGFSSENTHVQLDDKPSNINP